MNDPADWRAAARVVLHDHYTVLTLPECYGGIFAEYENETWRVEGDLLADLLGALEIPVPEKVKHKLWVEGLRLEKIPVHTGSNLYGLVEKEADSLRQLEARVWGERRLDLRLTYTGEAAAAAVVEVTYCGGFTVEWAP